MAVIAEYCTSLQVLRIGSGNNIREAGANAISQAPLPSLTPIESVGHHRSPTRPPHSPTP